MAYQLEFEKLLSYPVTDEGINLEVLLKLSDAQVKINAKIDTGATYSIFQRRFAEELGLVVETGIRQRFGTATGSFDAYGFRITLYAADLEFDSMVFFAADASFTKNVLGRIGWLDKIIIALNDYEGKLYLKAYE